MVLETYINNLKASKNNITEFDERLFYALVDKVKVNKDSIKIIWKDVTDTKKDICESFDKTKNENCINVDEFFSNLLKEKNL